LSVIIDKIFSFATKYIAIAILFLVAWIFTVLFQHSLDAMEAFGFDFITETK
jgi:phosphate transport system permease protein